MNAQTKFLPGEVYHVLDKTLAICPRCKCVTEHERVTDEELRIDGYVCLVCDGISINDFTHTNFAEY